MSDKKIKYDQLEILQLIMNNSHEIIWAIDTDYCLLFANTAYQNALKISGGKEMNTGEKVLSDDYSDEFKSFWKKTYDRCLNDETFTTVTEVPTIQGLHYIENSLRPLKDNNNTVCGAIITSIDITNKKQIENDLIQAKKKSEENEIRLVIAQKTSKAGAWDWDIENNTFYWSEEFYDIFGIHHDTPPGFETWTKVLHPDDINLANMLIQESIQNKSELLNEYRIILPNKDIRWIRATGKTFYKNETAHRMVGMCFDITNQKKTELELINAKEKAEESEEKYKILFDTMTEGVALNEIIYNENHEMVDYRILEVNNAFYNFGNFDPGKVIGGVATELYRMPSDYIKTFWQHHKTLCKTAYTEMISPLEPEKWFYVSTSPFVDDKFITVFFDITNLKKNEAELIKAKEKAEESDRLKTAFLQNMSHEIRTPMNAIMGFSELLVNNFDNKEKLKYFSKIINQRCYDLLIIIDDLLYISKIESGQLPVNIEPCGINSLFSELQFFFAEHQKKINKQHIKFSLQNQSDSTNLIFATDKVKLKQILINLIGNAFKFTDNGQIAGGYRLDNANNLIFYVSDTGIGIPADKQENIFQRFVQLETTPDRIYGGTGLGLSIVKGLINLLGGEIWIDSEVGVGSIFYFSLPYNSLKEDIKEISEVHIAKPNINYKTKKILIVEDDLYNTDYIKEILSEIEAITIYEKFGKNALEKALSHDIDLVLMDIGLPDMNGYDVISSILKQKPNLKIIVQTAYAADDDKTKAFKAGCVDYISKPIKPNDLLNKIYTHLI